MLKSFNRHKVNSLHLSFIESIKTAERCDECVRQLERVPEDWISLWPDSASRSSDCHKAAATAASQMCDGCCG